MSKKIDYRQMAQQCLNHLVRETRVTGQPVNTPEAAAQFVALSILAHGEARRENLGLICLDSANRILDARIINQGTVNQAQVYPREIARAALQVDATGIIIFHNHPAGQCQPSIDDLAVTKSLTEGLKLLEITLLDHLILAGNAVYSISGGRQVEFAPDQPGLF